jgi:sulfoxide reductase heme-binding subunit YedZ
VIVAAAANAKALWYLTRGTGVVALLLLTAGLVLGVTSSTRWKSSRTPRFVVVGLHRYVTLLALAFVVVHVATTVLDGFAPIRLWDALIPFVSAYRPIWLGLGAVAFDLLLALILTSLLRKRIGPRAWRAVHWLSYAAWPVALVHALGTGSDARTGWLRALAVACTAGVLLAAAWRIATARAPLLPVRVGAAAAALAVPSLVLVWALGGPLRTGWAARAGTPARLLAASRAQPATAAKSAPQLVEAPRTAVASLPTGSFTAMLDGSISERDAGNGLVLIQIDARTHGSFDGRVHVELRGVPLEDGGVQMLDSLVALLPQGAPAWASGRVVGLSGSQVLADVRAPSGRSARVLLDLRIDSSTRSVAGSLHGAPAGGSE